MDATFWHTKWARGETAFHIAQANPLLLAHFAALQLAKGQRVFMPLCGKSLDIHWLLANGYNVVGAELSPLAIEQLFAELGATAHVTTIGTLQCHSAPGIDIFVGDIFELNADQLGPVDAVYDRAALVALPADMRGRYAQHITNISQCAPQLLISYVYDQQLQNGPPFSVSPEEILRHYAGAYSLCQLANVPVDGGLRGQCAADEQVWLMTKTC